MKNFYSENLESQQNKKLIYYLESYSPSNVLIIFDHGLGDAVEFLDIYETLKTDYPKWNFTIGSHPTLDLSILHEDWIDITELNSNFVIPFNQSVVQLSNVKMRYNIDKLFKKYKFIFSIQFTDCRHPLLEPSKKINISKLNKCKVMEIGYNDDKILKRYEPPFLLNNPTSKYVMFHVGGSTDKAIKNPNYEDSEKIWNEIIQSGFIPVDIHINNATNISNSKIPKPEYMKNGISIRDSTEGLKGLIQTICTGRFIVGVLSGPLHLCNRLYGSDNCLGLEGLFKINNYIDTNMRTVRIQPKYIEGQVFEWLNGKYYDKK